MGFIGMYRNIMGIELFYLNRNNGAFTLPETDTEADANNQHTEPNGNLCCHVYAVGTPPLNPVQAILCLGIIIITF